MELSNEIRTELIKAQRTEITEYHVYKNIAKTLPDEENRKIVSQIGDDEKRHYETWKGYTGEAVKPNRFLIWLYTAISRVFGFTFGFKLMELGEEKAQVNYQKIEDEIPEAHDVIEDENTHEDVLLNLLDEEKLLYAGSVVLGLNDALVELTGALAGLTLAFRNVDTIALSGLVTGIAASLSMAASEYLSTSSEDTEKHPVKAAVYTGIAYVVTVALLILPYLLFKNEFLCLGITLVTSVIIIAVFNFYISVAKDEPFGKNFIKMTGLSLQFLDWFCYQTMAWRGRLEASDIIIKKAGWNFHPAFFLIKIVTLRSRLRASWFIAFLPPGERGLNCLLACNEKISIATSNAKQS